MGVEQPSFTDLEYGNRRRVSRREQFLETMDATIPWDIWVGLIEPFYYDGKKGQQWYFGMKAHIGVDAGTGYIHSVTATAASVHDLDEVTNLVRDDDRVVYADAGYQGVGKREEVKKLSPASKSRLAIRLSSAT